MPLITGVEARGYGRAGCDRDNMQPTWRGEVFGGRWASDVNRVRLLVVVMCEGDIVAIRANKKATVAIRAMATRGV